MKKLTTYPQIISLICGSQEQLLIEVAINYNYTNGGVSGQRAL